MDKQSSFPSRYISPTCVIITCCLIFTGFLSNGQQKNIDGKEFQSYKRSYFRPERGLQYNLYASSVLTVDPLGIGGKSTYAIGLGTRINLWESKSENNSLQGLKIKGFYAGLGYDLYPQQADDLYASLWMRVKTFMPITGKIDLVYSYGDGLRGISSRYCVGFEVKRLIILLTGSIHNFSSPVFGDHPHLNSPYTNVGSIMLIIPFYNHFPEVR